MEKKTNYFTVIALVVLVLIFVTSFFKLGLDTYLIIATVANVAIIAFSIAAIVYAKKIEKGKALPIVLLVISILGLIVFGILLAFKSIVNDPKNTAEICKQVVECEDAGEVSTCYIKEDTTKALPIKCYTTNLNADQFK